MEIFAFTQNSVGYEDPGAEPQLRSFDDINLEIPKSAILGAAGVAAATAVMSHSPDAHAIVDRGDVCPAVTQIQNALIDQGYANTLAPFGADGVYGSATETAVRAFQSRQNLSFIDGKVGPETATAMGLPTGISCGSTNPGGGGGTYRITTPSGVKVRVSPSTFAGEVFPGLGQGATVGLTSVRQTSQGYTWAQTSAGNWIAIGPAGTSSYVAQISGSTPTPTPQPGTGGGTYRVTTPSGVKVRVSPSTFAGEVFPGLGQGATVGLTSVRQTNQGYTWAQTSAGNWVALGPVSGGSYLVKIN